MDTTSVISNALRDGAAGGQKTNGRRRKMNVYVNGMKMPEIKENKSIKAEIRNLDGRLELGIMTGGYYCCEQWSYYPIIKVPDGHGRLIDADNFDERVRIAGGMVEEELTEDFKDGVQTTLAMLKTEKTIIHATKGEP